MEQDVGDDVSGDNDTDTDTDTEIIECDADLAACGQQCVDLNRDDSHCGECGNSCAQGRLCIGGRCLQSCTDDSDCEEVPENATPQCDGNGICTFQCDPEFGRCGDQCVDHQNDPLHCGDCFNDCGAVSCFDGQCSECDPAGTVFGGGSGSSEAPFEICSADQLRNLSVGNLELIPGATPSSHYELHTHIDLAGDPFMPIPTFTGSFDGRGQRISNVVVDTPIGASFGFFSQLDAGAEVRDVHFQGVTVDGTLDQEFVIQNYNAGGLTGRMIAGATISDVSIADIQITGLSNVGGIVGRDFGGSLQNVEVSDLSLIISALPPDDPGLLRANFGGLVGRNEGHILRARVSGVICEVDGAEGDNIQSVGGLVGTNATGGDGLSISQSMADVDISCASANQVAGLVGSNSGHIYQSYASGHVQGNDAVGGLVGENSGNIDQSYASGHIQGNEVVGGLVGRQGSSDVSNSYAVAAVTGEHNVGGLLGAGLSQVHSGHSSSIATSYAAGPVLPLDNSVAGGFIGTPCHITFLSAYWDENTTQQPAVWRADCGGCTSCPSPPAALTTADFASESPGLFEGFDFDGDESVWTFGTAPDGLVRPILRWQTE